MAAGKHQDSTQIMLQKNDRIREKHGKLLHKLKTEEKRLQEEIEKQVKKEITEPDPICD